VAVVDPIFPDNGLDHIGVHAVSVTISLNGGPKVTCENCFVLEQTRPDAVK
jgi:hypothetical protein